MPHPVRPAQLPPRPPPSHAVSPFASGILEPFLPTESPALPIAVRALLAIPDDVPLRVDEDPARANTGLHLLVHIGHAAERYTLVLHEPGQRALWNGRHLALSHQGPVARGVLDALLPRLRQADAVGDKPGLLADVRAAWRERREWLRVDPGEWATVGPHELLLRLLFRCNQDCSFCWQDRTWPALPSAVAMRWISQAAVAGKRNLTLSGGEPTLHPDLVALVAKGAETGMRVTVQTNAIQLGKPHVLGPLVAAGLSRAYISYHSADPVISDAVTAAPGTHRKTEIGIAACLAAGLRVTLNCVVNARTVAGLPAHATAIVERFSKLQLQPGQLAVSYTHPTLAWNPQERAHNAVSLLEVRVPLVTALQTLRAGQVAATAVEGGCSFPVCTLRDVPQFLSRRAHLVLPENDAPARTLAQACQQCQMADRCAGPRRSYLDKFGEEGLVPFERVPENLGAETDQTVDDWT